jgi:hypothetical protein
MEEKPNIVMIADHPDVLRLEMPSLSLQVNFAAVADSEHMTPRHLLLAVVCGTPDQF